ncbi:MAG: glycosyltransferase [Acidimicrobiales bacterium]
MAPDPVVLHVLEALEGGTARHLVDLVRHTPGVTQHVAIPARRVGGLTDATAATRLADAGAVVHLVDMRRLPCSPVNAKALLDLRRLIRQVQPDVVHAHSSVGGALGRVAAATAGVPSVYTPNGLATGRGALLIERLLGRVTARVVAVSPSEAELVRASRIIAADHIAIIANGIGPDHATPGPDLRALFGIPTGAQLVGTIARLVAQKAPERFVAVAADVLAARPDSHVVLIGDGPLRSLVTGSKALAPVSARFHHLPALDDAAGVIDQLDVFVLTSRFEGAPYAVMEAMRAAVPVVLTDVVGSRDLVVDGDSGILVTEHDTTAMARAVIALLDDPARIAGLGAAGRRRVAARYAAPNMGASVRELYDLVICSGNT